MRKIILSLYKKEMLDILRDKKTVLIMILVPIILYPLLFIGTMLATTAIVSNQEEATYKVAFADVKEADALETIMLDEEDDLDYHFEIVTTSDWKKALENKEIDVCITEKQKGKQVLYEIQYLSSVSASSTAADMMEDVIEEYREQLRKERIEAKNLDVTTVLYPVLADQIDRSSNEETFGSIIGSLLPFLMIVSILMGAIYPAIDATAGEKERGTLETLLTLPVSNFHLIISKFLAVSTIAAISALLNFVSVGIMGVFLFQSMSATGTGNINVDMVTFIPAILLMLVCVLVFAMLMSALCLCICIFAKSFKEAQNYSTPLLIVVMLVGYLGFIPGVELNGTYAIVPIANIVLLVKNIFTFQYSFTNLFLVLVTNIVYSFLAVVLMSKMYNSEALLFGEGGSVKLFESRANMKKGQMPGTGDAFLLLAISVLATFYIGSLATVKLGFAGVAVQQIIFLVLTVGFAWYMKADVKRLFSLRTPKVSKVIGSVFLWGSAFLMMLVITEPLSKVFPESMSDVQSMQEMFAEQPFIVLLLVVALLPAICEELLFRGFLFGTLKEKWKPFTAIFVSALIFGIYHMSAVKMVTISVLGMALAYSVYCSESIATSMLMHFCNNAIAMVTVAFPGTVSKICPFLMEEHPGMGTYIGMTVVAVVCLCVGLKLLRKNV